MVDSTVLDGLPDNQNPPVVVFKSGDFLIGIAHFCWCFWEYYSGTWGWSFNEGQTQTDLDTLGIVVVDTARRVDLVRLFVSVVKMESGCVSCPVLEYVLELLLEYTWDMGLENILYISDME